MNLLKFVNQGEFMNCFVHGDKEAKSKCVVCGKPLCEDCTKFQNECGACPKCLKKQAESMYAVAKRGIMYTILSLICAVAFLIIYIVEVCLGNFDKTYIIVGAVILATLVPLSVFMFVKTILKIKKYKNYLKNNKN